MMGDFLFNLKLVIGSVDIGSDLIRDMTSVIYLLSSEVFWEHDLMKRWDCHYSDFLIIERVYVLIFDVHVWAYGMELQVWHTADV